ncbi:MAG: hypothetical protein QMD06_00270 [Candidatus Altarchaeum sp.]|nr:hypothetical protein [Candidatus Altarchaeum sp.]
MEEQEFEAGKLRHKRYLTFFQLIIAFFTVFAVSSTFDIIPEVLYLPKFYLVLFLFIVIIILIIEFNRILNSLEKELGWNKSEEKKENETKKPEEKKEK